MIPAGWDEAGYLALHPDVAAAVQVGAMPSGWVHYDTNGRHEGRALPGRSGGGALADGLYRYADGRPDVFAVAGGRKQLIPNPDELAAAFGAGAWDRVQPAPAAVLDALPSDAWTYRIRPGTAQPTPAPPAGAPPTPAAPPPPAVGGPKPAGAPSLPTGKTPAGSPALPAPTSSAPSSLPSSGPAPSSVGAVPVSGGSSGSYYGPSGGAYTTTGAGAAASSAAPGSLFGIPPVALAGIALAGFILLRK